MSISLLLRTLTVWNTCDTNLAAIPLILLWAHQHPLHSRTTTTGIVVGNFHNILWHFLVVSVCIIRCYTASLFVVTKLWSQPLHLPELSVYTARPPHPKNKTSCNIKWQWSNNDTMLLVSLSLSLLRFIFFFLEMPQLFAAVWIAELVLPQGEAALGTCRSFITVVKHFDLHPSSPGTLWDNTCGLTLHL